MLRLNDTILKEATMATTTRDKISLDIEEKPLDTDNLNTDVHDGILSDITDEDVIHEYKPDKRVSGQVVFQLISSRYYVLKDANTHWVANQLSKMDNVESLGVVDENNEVVGVISRKNFFALLGKPYAREVFRNRSVARIMENAEKKYDIEEDVFTVADDLGERISDKVTYYAATERGNSFAGIFSTKDLLTHLSNITQKDIAMARRLQGSMVKEECALKEKKFDFIGYSQMAKGVGGDFYRPLKYNDTNWVFSVCDVSGKGVAAALITASIGGMFDMHDFNQGMGSFLKKLNSFILDTFESEKYLTGVFIKFNETTGEIILCDMGHGHNFLWRGGKLYQLEVNNSNLPIGIMPDIEPAMNKLTLKKDDILFIATDGILEQPNSEGEEYSIKRVGAIFSNHANKGLATIKEEILKDLTKFKGNKPQHDDLTMVMLKIL